MVNGTTPKSLISIINSGKSSSQNEILKRFLENNLTRENFGVEFNKELVRNKLKPLLERGFNLIDINKTLKSNFSIFYALEKKNHFYLIKVENGGS